DRALQDFDEAIRLDPNYADAYSNRGYAFMRKGDYDRAIADFDRVLELMPDDPTALSNRGYAYLNKGGYVMAIKSYDRALHQRPDATNYANRCTARALWGKELTKALADCNAALKLEPGNSETLATRGLVHYRASVFDKALADTNAAATRN